MSVQVEREYFRITDLSTLLIHDMEESCQNQLNGRKYVFYKRHLALARVTNVTWEEKMIYRSL